MFLFAFQTNKFNRRNDNGTRVDLHTMAFINWLAGGPADPQKIAASRQKYPTWYRRYSLTLMGVVLTYFTIIHPDLITRLNAEPDIEHLQSLQVRILKTREGDPHFDMQLPDGTVQTMEWPVRLSFSGRESVYFWNKSQRQALIGCQATVQVAPIRWSFTNRYRVWGLSCPTANFAIGVEQTTESLQKAKVSIVTLFVGFLILSFPLMAVIFLREKRGVL
jgi:hypothetical protein